jgi:hypothetical protein
VQTAYPPAPRHEILPHDNLIKGAAVVNLFGYTHDRHFDAADSGTRTWIRAAERPHFFPMKQIRTELPEAMP